MGLQRRQPGRAILAQAANGQPRVFGRLEAMALQQQLALGIEHLEVEAAIGLRGTA